MAEERGDHRRGDEPAPGRDRSAGRFRQLRRDHLECRRHPRLLGRHRARAGTELCRDVLRFICETCSSPCWSRDNTGVFSATCRSCAGHELNRRNDRWLSFSNAIASGSSAPERREPARAEAPTVVVRTIAATAAHSAIARWPPPPRTSETGATQDRRLLGRCQ